jgi:signal transduction histidine kinase
MDTPSAPLPSDPVVANASGAAVAGEQRSTAERAVGWLLARPIHFYLAPLCLSLAIALWPAEPGRDRGVVVGIAALATAWYVPWSRTSWSRPLLGSPALQAAFTLLGSAVLGLLVWTDFAFIIVCVPFVPRFFLTLPLRVSIPAALLVLVPVDFAFRAMTLLHQGTFGWLLLARVAVVVVLGVILRDFARTSAERRRLAERLAVAERRTGMLEERQRVARDIHDTLAQGFAGIVMHLETARFAGAPDSGLDGDAVARHTGAALDVARQSLEEARRMLRAMLPAALDGHDLGEALMRVAREWSDRTHIPSDVEISGAAISLQRDSEVALLRVLQEALSNVWTHAQATRVSATLSYFDDVVVLDVRDNGRGMSEGREDRPRHGLVGMRARLEALGGTVQIESAEGEGVIISATVPAVAAGSEDAARPSGGAP